MQFVKGRPNVFQLFYDRNQYGSAPGSLYTCMSLNDGIYDR